MHILRNSIESPEERGEKGETGVIELRAIRDRNHVVIEIEDDGRGLDREAVEEMTIETGIHTADELAAFSAEESEAINEQ